MTAFDHLFVSPTGTMLPAWSEAFPAARSTGTRQLASSALPTAVLWLRLDQDLPLDMQVNAVRARCGTLPIVVMSDLPQDDEALAALSAQARGYCNSHAGADVLSKIASVVSQGGLWIGETLMHRILSVQHLIRVPEAAARPDWRLKLTPREVEVAELAAAGTRYKEIARQLMITERTVKMHMAGILEKLGLRDRLQLALLASERHPAVEVAN
ncbi:response regulator transcription factor [Massilia sp. CF038]|uniref:response regulator transcription factor n=1 Tax=Massilia sp. CF038 TaxID=1881045 RepID=UPI000910D2C2|nr:response regulator transcription factor [Massilia sp. CF038]SHH06609.1 regulatory protein, luxR family [Massilia sp. CF038]